MRVGFPIMVWREIEPGVFECGSELDASYRFRITDQHRAARSGLGERPVYLLEISHAGAPVTRQEALGLDGAKAAAMQHETSRWVRIRQDRYERRHQQWLRKQKAKAGRSAKELHGGDPGTD